MKRKTLLLTLIMALLSSVAQTQPLGIIGAGLKTCGKFTFDMESHNMEAISSINWVNGYLAGIRVDGIDKGPAVIKWLEIYCKAKPLDTIYDAAYALGLEMRDRAND